MATGIRFTHVLLCAAAITLPAQAHAARDLASVLEQISAGFICPEFQPDDAARRAELISFSRALASVGPTRITYPQAVYVRGKILERHNCARPASAIASTEAITAQPAKMEAD